MDNHAKERFIMMYSLAFNVTAADFAADDLPYLLCHLVRFPLERYQRVGSASADWNYALRRSEMSH